MSDAQKEHRKDSKEKKPPRGGALVVVESPAKARTIKKYLGAGYQVKASVGHVKDLPTRTLGVDVSDSFTPKYEVIKGKGKILKEIRAAAQEVDRVLLAPDPDREGEAIAWHIAEELRPVNDNIERVLFNEITQKGIAQGLSAPRRLDQARFESQQARRILDRLVGYEISPVLWRSVRRGLSAGRVQSVAVRLVVDREREIEAFVPEEYFNITCLEQAKEDATFEAKLFQVDGAKAKVTDQETADALVAQLKSAPHRVARVERKERPRRPPAPFITSKLQQDAARKFRFPAKRTMALAQRLYEGIDLGGSEGVVGLITYMRTDSTRLSDDAVSAARDFIRERYGASYLPESPQVYAKGKRAQDAHEAIRPTDVRLDPELVRDRLLGSFKPGAKTSHGMGRHDIEEMVKLYGIIWRRFVACQMAAALYDQTTIDIEAGANLLLRAQGQVIAFPGYTAVYEESREENGNGGSDQGEEGKQPLPSDLADGEPLSCLEVRPEQKFTQPPPRFTEAGLVKELEERGIGRPSTYASITSTIQDRRYVEKQEGRFRPSELGILVNDLLVKAFPDILNVDFTAQMEDRLDRIEEGDDNWIVMLKDFYGGFHDAVERAKKEMKRPEDEETSLSCEQCGKPMVVKWGRNGKFLACTGYPECRNTKEFRRNEDGSVEALAEKLSDEICPTCGAPMAVKSGRFGAFLACSRYPECKTTKPISLGLKCPREGCGGNLVKKRSKRGKTFYGCDNYSTTKCDFVLWDRPVGRACDECSFPIMVSKGGRQGAQLKCPECGATVAQEPVKD
ncbi:MAG: type I DNA topoisomerase [Polyangia bacterium]|jgi:DNA topoisomerase-1|nr:type I DNA topoisomerase [Polyangia bacterium]